MLERAARSGIEPAGAEQRDRALDGLRGVAILLVLLLHLTPLQFLKSPASTVGRVLGFALTGFYDNVCELAVPLFFVVSLVLYFRRRTGPRYFRRRIIRLLEVLGFWLVVQYGLVWATTLRVPPIDYITIRTGGPSLVPGGAATVLYFLVDLAALVCLAEALAQVERRFGRRATLALSCTTIAASLVFFAAAPFLGRTIIFWSLEGFALYVPTAYLLREGFRPLRTGRWALCATFVVLAGAEYYLVKLFPQLPPPTDYGRLSIYVGTLACIGLLEPIVGSTRWLTLAGEYSLGIFVTHDLFKTWTNTFTSSLIMPTVVGTFYSNPIRALLTVGLTLGTVFILSKTPLRRFVK